MTIGASNLITHYLCLKENIKYAVYKKTFNYKRKNIENINFSLTHAYFNYFHTVFMIFR